MGMCLGDYTLDFLTNLRFADDVLLFATSMEQLQKMMCEFIQNTEKVGLRTHPGKTKQSSSRRRDMEIDTSKSTKEESTRCLGQMVTSQQQETAKIKNRIRAAWATFYRYKQELTSKSHLLRTGFAHSTW